jgi:hypothetical protein
MRKPEKGYTSIRVSSPYDMHHRASRTVWKQSVETAPASFEGLFLPAADFVVAQIILVAGAHDRNEGKARYKARSICECIHARWRNWYAAIDRTRHRKGTGGHALLRAHQQHPARPPPGNRLD